MRSQPSPDDKPLLENSDPLDRLLLSAPLDEPDPWFVARAIARCRYSEPARARWTWNRFGPRWAVGGVFSLFLLAFSFQQLHHSHKLLRHKERNVQEAFEIVASLGDDSDSSSSSWQDSSF